MLEIEEIVVPVDGSDGSVRAAAFGSQLAQASGVPIRLLHVFTNSPYAAIGLARMEPGEIERAQQSAAREIFQRARAATSSPAEVKETVLMGDPAQEIITFTEAHPHSLVVMGRRGLSPIQSLLVGSVSEKVARHGAASVTLVK